MAEYKGTVELIGGLTPKNNGTFPLASAKDIQVDATGKRLDEIILETDHGIENTNMRINYLCGGFDDNEQEAIKNYIDDKCANSTPGADGITPHIGENGNWFIGDEDTGTKAQGEDGAHPTALSEMGGDSTKTTYRLEFSNGTGYDFDVYHGKDGKDGKDADPYVLTEDDKALIVAQVIQSLGGNPVFGYVDDDNNIIVQGNLGDGTYSVKYEMEDGSTVDIGNLVLDTNVYYSITKNLTNCVLDNSATQVVAGGSYSATVTANSGYTLDSVSVTMGGSAVSVSGGVVSIESVTGDIVITAVANAVQVADPVTENLTLTGKTSITTDAGAIRENTAGYCTTPYIDVSNIPKPCTIKLEGAGWACVDQTQTTGYIRFYVENVSGTKLASGTTKSSAMPEGVTMINGAVDTGNGTQYTDITVTVTSDNVGKLRFAGCYTTVTPNGLDANVTKAILTYTPVA